MFDLQLSQSAILTLTILGGVFGMLWLPAIAWALMAASKGAADAEQGLRDRGPQR